MVLCKLKFLLRVQVWREVSYKACVLKSSRQHWYRLIKHQRCGKSFGEKFDFPPNENMKSPQSHPIIVHN
jgi:hypothetical protein